LHRTIHKRRNLKWSPRCDLFPQSSLLPSTLSNRVVCRSLRHPGFVGGNRLVQLYWSPSLLHLRFVSYHHLLGFFPRSPLLWRGPFPTVTTHRDPSEILSGLEAPLNQPVGAADARSHHPLVNTRPLSWNRNAWWRIPPPLLGSSPLVGWSRCGA